MDTKIKILENLMLLEHFFDEHNIRGWSERTRIAILQIQESQKDTKSILNAFIGKGMGSLIDLYVSADNGHTLKQGEMETNKHLEKLTEEILTINNNLG